MLVSVTRLNISNTGYQRTAKLEKIFINTEKIVSIVNYDEVKSFLLKEGNELSGKEFSLLKISSSTKKEEDWIVLGNPDEIVSSFNTSGPSSKEMLLD